MYSYIKLINFPFVIADEILLKTCSRSIFTLSKNLRLKLHL